jgi:hypothetical protein
MKRRPPSHRPIRSNTTLPALTATIGVRRRHVRPSQMKAHHAREMGGGSQHARTHARRWRETKRNDSRGWVGGPDQGSSPWGACGGSDGPRTLDPTTTARPLAWEGEQHGREVDCRMLDGALHAAAAPLEWVDTVMLGRCKGAWAEERGAMTRSTGIFGPRAARE